jgi:serine/threonine protein phosphatase 1
MLLASFFPEEDLEWMSALPFWYEDDHAVYVHAGLVRDGRRWLHPLEVANKSILLWVRTMDFFQNYRGKRVVCGHTATEHLPPELSSFTPADPTDMWAGDSVLVIDTGCGKGGFLTAVELPAVRVYESR